MLIVLTTVSTETEGVDLARSIVESKLAACVQVLPRLRSVYHWEGRVHDECESLLIIKTTDESYDGLAAFISENHSYDVPEIVAIEAAKANQPYLDWLTAAAQP